MQTIFLGSSATHSADEIRDYFDIDPDHEDGRSKFEQSFGCDYIEPGSYEVYDLADLGAPKFDSQIVSKLTPFDPDPMLLTKIDLAAAKSIF
ncbi:hypothetical protein GCM10007094_41130 [Pseudovibrio japonicus]|uniref:Uncharacterized protein n=1 Tax=Pseudovibrio japonicus TaxID=366534 RepID=A0ABQ3EMY7_9HYPH|nr:hypothetical protein [Pseudovibrio japonicus]GHB47613.1 hypothetical protein GCM10007094_41130 [Pseudovibrio japonicus]